MSTINISTDNILSAITIKHADRSNAVDIYSMVMTIDFYESIFSEYMTVDLRILDAAGILESYPIIGNEIVEVAFKMQEFDDVMIKEFIIQKIDGVHFDMQAGAKVYNIRLMSYFVEANLQTNISKSYSNKTESDIVENIFKNNFLLNPKYYFIEETKYKRNFVVPNWKPYRLLNYLATTAVRNTQTESPTFLFYENSAGLHFRSIEGMYSQNVTFNFTIAPTLTTNEVNMNHVIKVYGNKYFDSIENSAFGMYSSSLCQINLIDKTITYSEYDYDKEFKKYDRIDGNKSIKFYDVLEQSKDRKYQTIYNSLDDTKQFLENTSLRRTGLIQELRNTGITIEVMGNTLLQCGDVVTFALSNTTDSNMENFQYNGRWLIVSLRHMIAGKDFKTVLELRKPNFGKYQ